MIIPTTLDFTDKDRASLELRLQRLIRSVFSTWTETAIANFGNMIIDAMAHLGDVFLFYLDQWVRESRLGSAQLRRSLLALCKMLGYSPSGAVAATATETFTLAAAMPGDLTLAAGSKVSTAEVTEPAEFQLLEDLVFAAGELVKTATIEHSESQSDQFVSDDRPSQRFALSATPYLPDSLTLIFQNGTYSEVADFLDSAADDLHYIVVVDELNQATIETGNGINGAKPIGTGTAAYKTGGGEDGTLEAGTLTKLIGTYYDALGNQASVSVTNVEATTPGANRETNASIKEQAPRQQRVTERAIAREDFEIVAEGVTGVARALHLTRPIYAGVAENAGILFIVPDGGGTPTQTLLDTVLAQFRGDDAPYPDFNTYQLLVQVPNYPTIDVSARVWKREGKTPSAVKADITTALTNFFAVKIAASQLLADDPVLAARAGITADDGDALVKNPRVNFGYYFKDVDGNPTDVLAWSDMFNVVRDVASVRKVGAGATDFLLNDERADVDILIYGFPQLGTITLLDGDTGQTM